MGDELELKTKRIPQSYKFTVTANGPFGAIPAVTYIVDMGNWRESLNRPAGSLHQLTLAVKSLSNNSSS